MSSLFGGLVERADEMGVLERALQVVVENMSGQLVIISGEAGVGKSALVNAFCETSTARARVLWGACDALFTPRPLGPIMDVAEAAGGRLSRLRTAEARPHEWISPLIEELRHAPTILVLEDLHWADEATLDVVNLLSRRLDGVSVLVLATHRDDELSPIHPLRVVLGAFAKNNAVRRVPLSRLSPDGVARLASSGVANVGDLYRRTGGNPFFVTEVLAAGPGTVPLNVSDAVLARVARLPPAARDLVDAVSVVPLACEYWLLESLTPGSLRHLEECLASGVLLAHTATVSFRHEIARLAVEAALSASRRTALHLRALDALGSAEDADPARLAHHAAAAGNASAVIRFAPEAGRRAAAVGAHREAAEHFGHALAFAVQLNPSVVGDLLDRRAFSSYLSGNFPAAVEAQRQALEHHRQAGDRVKLGRAARLLSLLFRYEGNMGQAWELGREAVKVLEESPDSHELAMAFSNLSHLGAASEDAPQAELWAGRALALIGVSGDPEVEVYNSINLGSLEVIAGQQVGTERIERSLETALQHGLEELAGRAYVNLTWWSPRGRTYAEADRHLDAGLRYCDEHGLDLWHNYLRAYRARAALDRGHWGEAMACASAVVADPLTSPVPRAVALAVEGVVRARTGDGEFWPLLDEAWALASGTGELQRLEPVAAARAEAYWLASRYDQVPEATALALEVAVARGSQWVIGEMLSWRKRAGFDVTPQAAIPQPYASEVSGSWERAAEVWRELDAPYEAAVALSASLDATVVRQGFDQLVRLGSQPAAGLAAQRLRRLGAPAVPRGPRPGTRGNPAHLTSREIEVATLLACGAHNQDIADRLVLSRRTVDNHVSSVLRKLGVDSRDKVAKQMANLGLQPEK